MNSISRITNITLKNLNSKNIDPTPAEYTKEFCKVSKELKLTVDECKYFTDALKKLSKNELEENKHIETVYDLIDILLLRIETKNISKMSELLQQSMQPSIAFNFGNELNAFSIKIGDSPSLIFEESIQQEMFKFIEKRFEVDKKVVAKKTADIARLITLMSKYLSDAIDSNKNSSSNVTGIKQSIMSLKKGNTKDELNKLQAKLVEAAITIENEMSHINENLTSGKNEVAILENKVKELERELAETKLKNIRDHLTGTLTRSAYEDELKKADDMYKRYGQDFAIVFFDIDHFKKVNDTYGHEGGDVILKTFAALLLKLTRDTDVIGRYGGEEFVAIVRYTNDKELDTYISRIKNVVSKNNFIYKEHKIHITFSAGVELRSNNASADETVANADKLLYKAKETGRDKIVFYDGHEL